MFATLRARLDSWPLILVFGLIYFVSQAAIAVIVHPLGADMLIVQTTLSDEHVREIFARWATAGLLDTYASHYRFDNIHPLWYAMLLATMLAKGFSANGVPARFNVLLLLPFVAGACDVTENLFHQSFLADRANITAAHVLMGNGAAIVKWLLALGCLLGVGALGVRAKIVKGAKGANGANGANGATT